MKVVSLAWIMDSESKNKNSRQTLSQNQRDNEQPNRAATTEMLTAFPDAVHVTKNGRASFANWYSFVDGNHINLFLLSSNCTGSAYASLIAGCLS